MPNPANSPAGSVVAIWRYPVKSMRGEELDAAEVTPRGVLGDRAYALIDVAEGKIVSAKNPRKWPNLFDFQAGFAQPISADKAIPPARITLPDGNMISSRQPDAEKILSQVLGREVNLITTPPQSPSLEKFWPDVDGLEHRDTTTEESIRPGSFFDGAAIHLLTTATLGRLGQLYPQGRFDPLRYRPNFVIQPASGEDGFVENQWIGRTLVLGETVRLTIDRLCPRCVVTTLAQGDLAADPAILRTVVEHNDARAGVYAGVVAGGTIHRGDSVWLE